MLSNSAILPSMLTRSASTMSVSYVVDFTALLLLGPEQTVFVAAASAIAQ